MQTFREWLREKEITEAKDHKLIASKIEQNIQKLSKGIEGLEDNLMLGSYGNSGIEITFNFDDTYSNYNDSVKEIISRIEKLIKLKSSKVELSKYGRGISAGRLEFK